MGSVLVPQLLNRGYVVKVMDLFIYGNTLPDPWPNLSIIRGDIRDQALLKKAMYGMDAVIDLAFISNDPSCDLNPALAQSINLDAFPAIVDIAKNSGVQRFIFASSSSVYGIKQEENVTEDLSPAPITQYAEHKANCESILFSDRASGFSVTAFRPGTHCGYSPRQRLDLTINKQVNQAVNIGTILVDGGARFRPNIHVLDMFLAYQWALEARAELIDGQVFNIANENYTVSELAERVRAVVGDHVKIETTDNPDRRSCRLNSDKLKQASGLKLDRTVEDAVKELIDAFWRGWLPDSLTDPKYFNIEQMKRVNLK
jgi:nucleoside-diphosphate-sugar epimerase